MSVYSKAIENLGIDLNAPLTKEGMQAIDAEVRRLEAAPSAPKNDPRKAAPVNVPAVGLAAEILMENGASEAEAWRTLAKNPHAVPAAQLADRLAQLQAEADERARVAYERSPEGKREAAEQALTERAEQDRLAAGAKELLRRQGLFSAERIAEFSAEEALIAAGLEKSPAQLRQEKLDADAIRLNELQGKNVPTSTEPLIVGNGLDDVWGNS